jgi:hypothetical protein
MKKLILICGFLVLLGACDWQEKTMTIYEFALLDEDSIRLINVPVASYDPIEKPMNNNVLLFDANQGYTSFVVKQAMRNDSFKLYYEFDVVDDEVLFKNFRFESATIKRADISYRGVYNQEFPFIKLFLPK